MSNFLSAIFSVLALPLLLLNVFSIVGGAIWLVVLGEWKLVVVGFFLLVVSSFLLAIILIPSALVMAPAAYFLQKRVAAGALVFVFLGNLYVVAVMIAWCSGALFVFTYGGDRHDLLPRLLWSYAVAIGPWAYMTSRESGEGGSAIATLFAVIAYLLVMALVLSNPLNLVISSVVFAFVMLIAVVFQTLAGFARMREV